MVCRRDDDGGDCLPDLAVLRDQPALFGPVASTPTAWQAVERSAQDPDGLARLRACGTCHGNAGRNQAHQNRPFPRSATENASRSRDVFYDCVSSPDRVRTGGAGDCEPRPQ
jgi:hypothetical protein